MDEPAATAIAVLSRLKQIALSANADMRLVATSAIREARNSNAFLRHVQKATDLHVQVISGTEEARLVYLGALQALPIFDKTVILVDIGGGSTEIVLGKQGKLSFAISLKLGHLRLFETCKGLLSDDGMIDDDKIRECRSQIQLVLAESTIKQEIADLMQGEVLDFSVGSSGTIERVADMIAARKSSLNSEDTDSKASTSIGSDLEEKKFTRDELSTLMSNILACKSRKERIGLPGINVKRVDLIVTGCLILKEVMDYLELDMMKVSPFALREGIIVDALSEAIPDYNPVPDIRRDSIMHLATRFDTENRLRSAKHSAKLAAEIINGLREGAESPAAIEKIDERHEFLLEAAILLHSVGIFVNHNKHHKHAYYIIKNSDILLGFMPIEIEIVAMLALFHRKKYPSKKNAQFAKLPQGIRDRIIAMTSIMRIAIALDRRNLGNAVESVSVLQDGEKCIFVIMPGEDADGAIHDVSFELWAAKQELPYFSKVFSKDATLVEGDRGMLLAQDQNMTSISS